MRFYDIDKNVVYWYHGIDVQGDKEHKLFTSEFDDDIEAIPMYEQIYAFGRSNSNLINLYLATMNDSIKISLNILLIALKNTFKIMTTAHLFKKNSTMIGVTIKLGVGNKIVV